MEAVVRALADEGRRTLLERLSRGPATAGELAALLPIARTGVSRHLRVLREAGLVDVRREGQRRIYELRPEPLAELDGWLAPYRELWQPAYAVTRDESASSRPARSGSPAPTAGRRRRAR